MWDIDRVGNLLVISKVKHFVVSIYYYFLFNFCRFCIIKRYDETITPCSIEEYFAITLEKESRGEQILLLTRLSSTKGLHLHNAICISLPVILFHWSGVVICFKHEYKNLKGILHIKKPERNINK